MLLQSIKYMAYTGVGVFYLFIGLAFIIATVCILSGLFGRRHSEINMACEPEEFEGKEFPEVPVSMLPCCTVPPPGWYCTRGAGHDGPCAARQVNQ